MVTHRYTIPFRDRLIIVANLILTMLVSIFMWQISNLFILPFLLFIVFEMMIMGILLKWGQAVDTMRFGVLVAPGIYVFLTLSSLCCRVSPGVWIIILLFYITKLCRNDYAGKFMMNVNSQQVYSMTSTPMGPTTLPSGTAQRQSEFKNVRAIGFANVSGNDPSAPGVTNNGQNYGWAV